MASNKAKRSIHLAQLQAEHRESQNQKSKPERRSPNPETAASHASESRPAVAMMPVKTHIYRAIADLNAGFEKVMQDIGNLKQINFFRSDPLTAMQDSIGVIRAQANREFMEVLSRREDANAAHFEARCREQGIAPPACVLVQK
jgi:hypothetical protein